MYSDQGSGRLYTRRTQGILGSGNLVLQAERWHEASGVYFRGEQPQRKPPGSLGAVAASRGRAVGGQSLQHARGGLQVQ